MKKMNKFAAALLAVVLCLTLSVSAFASSGFNAGIEVTREGNEIAVVIQDSTVLHTKMPTLSIPADASFEGAVVLFEGSAAVVAYADGQVSFKVAKGGNYYIVKGIAGEVTKAPTCTKEGITTYVYNGVTYVEETARVAHDFTDAQKTTCANCLEPNPSYEGPLVALVDGTGYETLSEALRAANSGEIVQLLKNTTEEYVSVLTGVTLDLNGKNLTVNNSLMVFGEVIDSTDGSGLLKVTNATMTNSGYLPVYDTVASGYRLYEYEFDTYGVGNKTDSSATFCCTLKFTNTAAWQALVADNDSVKLSMEAVWGEGQTLVFNFGEVLDTVANTAGNNHLMYYYVTVSGLNTIAGETFVVTPVLESGILSPVSVDAMSYEIPAAQ